MASRYINNHEPSRKSSARLAQGYVLNTLEPLQRMRANSARVPIISLHQAARENKLDVVKDRLEEEEDSERQPKQNIDAVDEHGFAPIHYAAKFNCYRILQLLIEKGADPTVKTRGDKLTPLHLAAHYQPCHQSKGTLTSPRSPRSASVNEERHSSSKKAVELLVSHSKVDVNAKSIYFETPLHMACRRSNFDAVEVLIGSKDIKLIVCDGSENNTPLHEACKQGDPKVVKIIMDKLKETRREDKDWLLTNNCKLTPLHLACREGHGDIVKTLLDAIPEDCKEELFLAKDNEGNTALDLACQKGSTEVINHLLEKDVPLDTTNGPKHVTPLHIAAKHGHKEVVKALLEKDADLAMVVDTDRKNAVHYAVLANDNEVLEAFINNLSGGISKSLMTAVDKHYRTPLLLAAMLGKDAAFKMLLEALSKNDHEAFDRNGRSVLCLAAEGDHVPILKIFEGSSPSVFLRLLNTPDTDLNTPLHLAAQCGNVATVKHLLSLRDSLEDFLVDREVRNIIHRTPVHLAAKNGHAAVISELKFSSFCDAQDDNGDTPLHLACRKGHLGVAQVLRNEKVDSEAKNYKDHTPLHCAAIAGHNKLVKLLVTSTGFNVDVDPVDKNNATPLHLAAQAGHVKVVNRLLEHNADVSKRVSVDGMTSFNALDLAIDAEHEKVAMAIVQSSQWQKALRNTTTSPNSVWGETTPLRKLIRNMPRVAEVVLDRCTTLNECRIDSKNYQIGFDYEFVEDFKDPLARPNENGIKRDWGPTKYSKANHPLTLMVEYGRTRLLTHPLVTSLLRLKWNRYGAFAYGLHLFIYAIFVAFLTAFALMLPNPESKTCKAVDGDIRIFGEVKNCSNETLECGYCLEPTKDESVFLLFASVVIAFLSVVGFGYYIYLHARLYTIYLKDFATVFNFAQAILAFIFVVVLPSRCYCPFNWQWQLGTLAVYMSWINFSVLFRKLPLIGIYVVMFVKIFYTFVKVIILFFLLLIAFSLAFYMAFNLPTETFRHSPFSTPARSMVKTMTMIVGEFEFEDLFNLSSLEAKKKEDVFVPIPYDEVASLLWITFLILGPILFLNMLTGLAVDDIKRIQEDAALRRLELQIVGVLSIDEIAPSRIRNRFMIVSRSSITPNQGHHRLWESFRHKWWEEESYDTVGSISKSYNDRRVQEESHRYLQQGAIIDDIARIKRTLHRLDSFMEKMAQNPSFSRYRSVTFASDPHSSLVRDNTVDYGGVGLDSLVSPQPISGTVEHFFQSEQTAL